MQATFDELSVVYTNYILLTTTTKTQIAYWHAQQKNWMLLFHNEVFVIEMFPKRIICIKQREPRTIYEPFNVSISVWTTIDIYQVLPIKVSRSKIVHAYSIHENAMFVFNKMKQSQ